MFFNCILMVVMLLMMFILGMVVCYVDDGKVVVMLLMFVIVDMVKVVDVLKVKICVQLVQVKGGMFLMGDFGLQYNDEKLFYFGIIDDDVLCKVMLDDYVLQLYKVSYVDFDVYIDVVGKFWVVQSILDQFYCILFDIVVGVSWIQVVVYCEWIGKQIGILMILFIEVQWEYVVWVGGKMWVYVIDIGMLEDGCNVFSIVQYDVFVDMYGMCL